MTLEQLFKQARKRLAAEIKKDPKIADDPVSTVSEIAEDVTPVKPEQILEVAVSHTELANGNYETDLDGSATPLDEIRQSIYETVRDYLYDELPKLA